jgi:hypothetical protein
VVIASVIITPFTAATTPKKAMNAIRTKRPVIGRGSRGNRGDDEVSSYGIT